MTDAGLLLAELLEKAGEGDFLRSVAEAVLQLLMEADAEGLIGAGRHERSAERLYRPRFLGHRVEAYAARAAGESRSVRIAAGGLKPCRFLRPTDERDTL